MKNNTSIFLQGMRDGLPIGFGYFAVSFSLGIVARKAGLTAFQGFLSSLLTNASAGEYVVFVMIASSAPYLEVVLVTLITNARYLLMSCALSQRFSKDTPLWHRLLIGFDITDEVFGITISRPGNIVPAYTYGAMVTSIPFWATGTMLGIIAGSILPASLVSALSVALYGMFLAIIIPPSRKEKSVAVTVLASFICSYLFNRLPVFSFISGGTKTIILTVVIAAAAAIIWPVPVKDTLKEDISHAA